MQRITASGTTPSTGRPAASRSRTSELETATWGPSTRSTRQPGATAGRAPVGRDTTASVTSTVKWTPPAAAGTTAVTAAATTHSSAAASPSVSSFPLPPGLIPNLNAEASLLIGAGNAARLFPAITPSAGPSASQAADPQGGRQNGDPIANAGAVSSGQSVLTAQVAGLIALGLAIMLTVTRLSLRKRSGSRGSGG